MKKFYSFKKVFAAALLAMFCGNVMAAEEIDFTSMGYENSAEMTTVKGTDVTLTFSLGTGTNGPKYYTSGTAVRMYSGNTLVFDATKNMIKISFTYSESNLMEQGCYDVGTYEASGTTGTWTGSAAKITLTHNVSKQFRIQKIKVYYEGDDTSEESTTPSTPTEVETTPVTIESLNGMTDKTANVKLTLTNAKVVYVDGKNIYVREGDYAVMFYNSALELPLNSTLNGSVIVDYSPYYGVIEVKDNTYTNLDAVTITNATSETLDPVTVAISEVIALKHVADLVKLEGVTIVSEEKNYYAVSGEEKVQLYSRSRADLYKNIADDGNQYDVIALFNNIYKGAAEIDPVEINGVGTGINNINAENVENAPAYNMAGQRVSNSFKGIVIKNGKKFIK